MWRRVPGTWCPELVEICLVILLNDTWADLGARCTFSRGLDWEQGCLNTLMTNCKQRSDPLVTKKLRIMVLTGREAMTPQHTLKTARVATIKISCTSISSAWTRAIEIVPFVLKNFPSHQRAIILTTWAHGRMHQSALRRDKKTKCISILHVFHNNMYWTVALSRFPVIVFHFMSTLPCTWQYLSHCWGYMFVSIALVIYH